MANYRSPNGYGAVVKLSGNRRNPFVARKTVGYDDRAYPIYAVIGYYPSRTEAMMALADYNRNPYDIDLSKITFSNLYDKWKETEMPKMKEHTASCLRSAYKHCSSLFDKQYTTIRKYDMQKCIDDCGKSYSTQSQIRNLLATLDKYAYDQDIIKKCYSANLTIAETAPKRDRVIFTDDEVKLLHKHEGEKYIDETLFMLYTGCRVSEMLLMKCENIDLEQGIMRGGVKTAAGKNRIIPIHPLLEPIIRRHLSNGEYLFDYKRNPENVDPDGCVKTQFGKAWNKKMKALGLNHTTHECRHTFRSKLDSADANKVCIDLIVGHRSSDVGERVYTHKTVEQLKATILKLSYGLCVSNT